jgi:2,3-bisphosphoglycerate-dependent phosphoglycerate mutase
MEGNAMVMLILLRHGQSLWNLEGRFTGWTDVDLSKQGVGEARRAAELLQEGGYTFDIAYTSVLKRAIRTLWIVMDDMDLMYIPVHRSWRLNEKSYGALQGLSKQETAAEYGKEAVHLWRRGYDVRPPPLSWDDKRHPRFDPRYAGMNPDDLPATESLHDTLDRTLPYWHSHIRESLREGKTALISAHGNSLRALVKYLDNVSDEAISDLNIPTGYPLVYELDGDLNAVRHEYLGNPDEIAQAERAVAQQASPPAKTGREPPFR